MNKYYFTYGTSEDFPFQRGWTEVVAPDLSAACSLFRMIHPDLYEHTLNCSDVYSEAELQRTQMYAEGNFGVRAHEIITLQHVLLNN